MTMQADLPYVQREAAKPLPPIRDIHAEDVTAALRAGWGDFVANPTSWIFLGLIYPIVGLILAFGFSGANLLPLVFPLISGFALIGPFAALGIYQMSKRREEGFEPKLSDAVGVTHSPAIGQIATMGLLLFGIFAAWLAVAYILWMVTESGYVAQGAGDFLRHILTTPSGWVLIVLGNLIGLAFAAGVLAISAISFPLLLDRPQTDVPTAIRTSVEAMRVNPKSMTVWGLMVAALLILGSIPLFVGLAIVVPLLGHATWHLYRQVIRD